MHASKHSILDPLSFEPSSVHIGLCALTDTSSSLNEVLEPNARRITH